ncbi:MAG TPA: hypothetical protein VGC30_04255 [Dokdonella sp.]
MSEDPSLRLDDGAVTLNDAAVHGRRRRVESVTQRSFCRIFRVRT